MNSNDNKKRAYVIIVVIIVISTFIGGLVLGVIGGIIYAQVINPLEFVDALPPQLHMDFQFIYINLVIDSYALNRDLDLATAHLHEWEEPEIVSLLSIQLEKTVAAEDYERAELIRDILLTYHDQNQTE
jgi:hypothetical protein